jgi:hypothetical protein
MNASEQELLERGWAALVEQLGRTDATRFVMLLDRRTGMGVQHLQHIWANSHHTASPHCLAAHSTRRASE